MDQIELVSSTVWFKLNIDNGGASKKRPASTTRFDECRAFRCWLDSEYVEIPRYYDTIVWYRNSVLHRDPVNGNDEPASIRLDIDRQYWRNGKLRRQPANDGSLLPVMENSDGKPMIYFVPEVGFMSHSEYVSTMLC